MRSLTQQPARSEIALASILVSAIATGFTCTIVSHDIDTDPASRRKNPTFYGYVPDAAMERTINFASTWTLCTCQMIARSVLTALLLLVHVNWFWIFFGADLTLFFMYKIFVQKEFFHRVPTRGLIASVFATICVRIVVKVLTDYTAIIHFRQPAELSGLYWTLNLFITFGGLYGSIFVYDRFYAKDESLWGTSGEVAASESDEEQYRCV